MEAAVKQNVSYTARTMNIKQKKTMARLCFRLRRLIRLFYYSCNRNLQRS